MGKKPSSGGTRKTIFQRLGIGKTIVESLGIGERTGTRIMTAQTPATLFEEAMDLLKSENKDEQRHGLALLEGLQVKEGKIDFKARDEPNVGALIRAYAKARGSAKELILRRLWMQSVWGGGKVRAPALTFFFLQSPAGMYDIRRNAIRQMLESIGNDANAMDMLTLIRAPAELDGRNLGITPEIRTHALNALETKVDKLEDVPFLECLAINSRDANVLSTVKKKFGMMFNRAEGEKQRGSLANVLQRIAETAKAEDMRKSAKKLLELLKKTT